MGYRSHNKFNRSSMMVCHNILKNTTENHNFYENNLFACNIHDTSKQRLQFIHSFAM